MARYRGPADNIDSKLPAQNQLDSEKPTRGKLSSFLESLAFAVFGALVFHLSGMWEVMKSDDRLLRTPFYIGVGCTLGYVCIFLYLVFYLNRVRNIPIEFQALKIHSPATIPTATALMLTSGLTFTIAFWPVYRWLTIPVLFVVFLGAIAFLSLFG